ncbi:DUF4365 domain-containing protein [Alcaligenes sp. 13f]|uniref:DUF4365 domain-containing protein n=1 Tax=Alcaligenes sp. 13f TaxID=2841924 RepID=UPI001CF6CF14|nr:DUF4365 domain-containing protein [Alcaligenes sp. 13f]MCB4321904.1 DUF4365 domain-containing protein [Alcaligenes sp. 13f]
MKKSKKIYDTTHIGQIGVSWVTWIVEGLWGCGVEVVSAHNDNSIDVLIFLKRREKTKGYAGPTGDVIFAQIKTGYRSKMPPKTGTYALNLGGKYNSAHLPRWLSMPGPAIMIHVTPPRITKGDPIAYWVDLKDPRTLATPAQITFDVKRKFDAAGKGEIYNLCWRWAELRQLPTLMAPNRLPWSNHMPVQALALAGSFHDTCRGFYTDWMRYSKANPGHFVAQVTNRGWRHMTRIGRSKQTMFQSLLLLPVASRMLEQSSGLPRKRLSNAQQKTRADGSKWDRYYEAITARVTFYERQEAVIRVIIECTKMEPTQTSGPFSTLITRCLYSVYELARRR